MKVIYGSNMLNPVEIDAGVVLSHMSTGRWPFHPVKVALGGRFLTELTCGLAGRHICRCRISVDIE